MTVTLNSHSMVEVFESKISPDQSKALGLGSVSAWCSKQWRAIIAEVVSTMMLLLFGCMTCIPLDNFPVPPPMYIPVAFGLIVLFNIQIFGHISGAHMNPAVTLAYLIWGSMSVTLAVAYVIAQCIGAILGYGILVAIAPMDIVSIGVCFSEPHAGHTLVQALFVEAALTSILSLLCCACWDPANEHKQDSMPVKIGLGIVGLSLAGGPLTGANMNPARTLGPCVWTGLWDAHWIYWVGPLFGSSIAAIFYKLIWLNKKQD